MNKEVSPKILVVALLVSAFLLWNLAIKKAPVPQPVPTLQVASVPINVTSQIVKKVDGKYRYFFDIRNNDTKPFSGSVKIELITQNKSLRDETFNTTKPIDPKLGTSVHFDILTGPTSVHGLNGIDKFKYTVKINDSVINTGEGKITDKLESF